MKSPSEKLPITAIVLTKNEEINLPDCLQSIHLFVDQIIVVDSFSTDRTQEIAKNFDALFFQNPWKNNHGIQFQWALENTPVKNPWILRIDADERWTKTGFETLSPLLYDPKICGISVKMQIYFMGKWLKHGSLYGHRFLRIFRFGKGMIETRWMDEHIQVDGHVIHPDIDVIEANYDRQAHIGLWTIKHNNYSLREAVDFFIARYHLIQTRSIASISGGETELKRWIKENIYPHIPILIRPLLYFFYRYFLRLGFLDGKEGLIFHILQGFWYRFLVDVKILEIEKKLQKQNADLKTILKNEYQIEL